MAKAPGPPKPWTNILSIIDIPYADLSIWDRTPWHSSKAPPKESWRAMLEDEYHVDWFDKWDDDSKEGKRMTREDNIARIIRERKAARIEEAAAAVRRARREREDEERWREAREGRGVLGRGGGKKGNEWKEAGWVQTEGRGKKKRGLKGIAAVTASKQEQQRAGDKSAAKAPDSQSSAPRQTAQKAPPEVMGKESSRNPATALTGANPVAVAETRKQLTEIGQAQKTPEAVAATIEAKTARAAPAIIEPDNPRLDAEAHAFHPKPAEKRSMERQLPILSKLDVPGTQPPRKTAERVQGGEQEAHHEHWRDAQSPSQSASKEFEEQREQVKVSEGLHESQELATVDSRSSSGSVPQASSHGRDSGEAQVEEMPKIEENDKSDAAGAVEKEPASQRDARLDNSRWAHEGSEAESPPDAAQTAQARARGSRAADVQQSTTPTQSSASTKADNKEDADGNAIVPYRTPRRENEPQTKSDIASPTSPQSANTLKRNNAALRKALRKQREEKDATLEEQGTAKRVHDELEARFKQGETRFNAMARELRGLQVQYSQLQFEHSIVSDQLSAEMDRKNTEAARTLFSTPDTTADLDQLNKVAANEDTTAQDRSNKLLGAQDGADVERLRSQAQQQEDRLLEKDKEIQQLTKDVHEYKKHIARGLAPSTAHDVADIEMAADMDNVFDLLIGFAHKLLKQQQGRLKTTAPLPTQTRTWTNTFIRDIDALPPNCHIPALVTIISRTLCESFRAHYYFGISTATPIQAASHFAKALRPERHASDRGWFEDVSTMIDKRDSTLLAAARSELQMQMARSVEKDIGSMITNLDWDAGLRAELTEVFGKAVDVFRRMHRQRGARYFVDMVPVRREGRMWKFSGAQMVDLLGGDEEGLEGRELEVSVFPVVYKRGGEEDVVAIVSKGKVILQEKRNG